MVNLRKSRYNIRTEPVKRQTRLLSFNNNKNSSKCNLYNCFVDVSATAAAFVETSTKTIIKVVFRGTFRTY